MDAVIDAACRGDNEKLKPVRIALALLPDVSTTDAMRLLEGYCVLNDDEVYDAVMSQDWDGLWPTVTSSGHIVGVTEAGGNAHIKVDEDGDEYMEDADADYDNPDWRI